jgi:hypothetical protein
MSPDPLGRDQGPTWPTIDQSHQELNIDRTRTKKLIQDLEKDLKKYINQHNVPGLPADLTKATSKVSQQEVGAGGQDAKTSYPAGQKIWEMVQRVNDGQDGFPAAYNNFVNTYREVIAALYTNAGFYDDAEHSSTLPQGTTSTNQGGTQPATGGQQTT